MICLSFLPSLCMFFFLAASSVLTPILSTSYSPSPLFILKFSFCPKLSQAAALYSTYHSCVSNIFISHPTTISCPPSNSRRGSLSYGGVRVRDGRQVVGGMGGSGRLVGGWAGAWWHARLNLLTAAPALLLPACCTHHLPPLFTSLSLLLSNFKLCTPHCFEKPFSSLYGFNLCHHCLSLCLPTTAGMGPTRIRQGSTRRDRQAGGGMRACILCGFSISVDVSCLSDERKDVGEGSMDGEESVHVLPCVHGMAFLWKVNDGRGRHDSYFVCILLFAFVCFCQHTFLCFFWA